MMNSSAFKRAFFASTPPVLIQDIRDVKPPLTLPSPWVAVMIFLILIVAIVGLVCLWHHRYRQRQKTTSAKRVIQSPWEKAYERFRALEESDLLARGQWEQYYLELSDIVRRYFEERFEIHAPEMTSEEFLLSLRQSSALNESSKDILKQFLIFCDMVKFARHAPHQQEAYQSLQLGRRMIDDTKIKDVTAAPS